MRYLLRYLLCIFAFLAVAGWGPFSFFSSSLDQSQPFGSQSWIDDEIRTIHSQADNMNPAVLKIGLTAYLKARQEGLDQKQLLTVVDYSKPSNERRLWVIDLKNAKVFRTSGKICQEFLCSFKPDLLAIILKFQKQIYILSHQNIHVNKQL